MHVTANGLSTHVALAGDRARPVVMFSHALGAALEMWEPQLELADGHRLLRYDTRGHGRSEATKGAYTLDLLVDDAVGVLDALAIERVWFVGLSMGGMIAELFALRHPERLHGVILAATMSEFPAAAHAAWDERIARVRAEGMESQVEPAIERWFTPAYRAAHGETVDRIRAALQAASPEGYVGCCEAVRGLALTERLGEIRVPALVIAGADDPGAGPAVAERVHERIPGAELEIIPSASHLCNVEAAEPFDACVRRFITENSS